MEKFKIVLLGSDDNVYGISRSFYDKYGVTTIALGYGHLVPTRFTKLVEVKVIENFNIEEDCIKAIIEEGKKLKESYEKLILVPCSDWYMEVCIKHKDELKGIYENNFIDASLLESFITKDKFYELCDKYDLPYPRTIICPYEERETIHEKIEFSYPLVLKPNNSNSNEYLYCEFPGKKKVFIVNSEDELKEIIKNMNTSTYKDNLIIQEFVKGDDTHNRVINCYSDKNGKVRMMSLGRPILEEYAPGLMGNYAAIISEPGHHKIFDAIKNMLESIKYTGFSNFDLKYDSEKKEFYLFEINYRQGRSSFYVNASGVSLAELLVDDLIENKEHEEIIYSKDKILWLNVPEDVVLNYVRNESVLNEVKELIDNKKVTHTLFYDQDYNEERFEKMNKHYNVKREQYEKYFIEKEVD